MLLAILGLRTRIQVIYIRPLRFIDNICPLPKRSVTNAWKQTHYDLDLPGSLLGEIHGAIEAHTQQLEITVTIGDQDGGKRFR